ncbi:hypothetical protein [Bacteroides pyogenes]|uniref:hypothetical protein n=1 Tax=Bacteroides pyogenes TaxID=310300 RepID=UPI00242A4DF9|nr:hypothetical protein [Bacteroides pyogenes]
MDREFTNDFTINLVLNNLVGPIKPIGETNEDDIRFKNLKKMCDLTDSLIAEIEDVACKYENNHEYSIKRAAEYAKRFLAKTRRKQ